MQRTLTLLKSSTYCQLNFPARLYKYEPPANSSRNVLTASYPGICFPDCPSVQLFPPTGASSFSCPALGSTRKITYISQCRCSLPQFYLQFYPSHFSSGVQTVLPINNHNQHYLLYLLAKCFHENKDGSSDYFICCHNRKLVTR